MRIVEGRTDGEVVITEVVNNWDLSPMLRDATQRINVGTSRFVAVVGAGVDLVDVGDAIAAWPQPSYGDEP